MLHNHSRLKEKTNVKRMLINPTQQHSVLLLCNVGLPHKAKALKEKRCFTYGVENMHLHASREISFPDVDILDLLVSSIIQCYLNRDHLSTKEARLPGKGVMGRQSFPTHPVKQHMSFHWHKDRRADLLHGGKEKVFVNKVTNSRKAANVSDILSGFPQSIV